MIATIHSIQCDYGSCDSTLVGNADETRTQLWQSAHEWGWQRSLSLNGMIHICGVCMGQGYKFGNVD